MEISLFDCMRKKSLHKKYLLLLAAIVIFYSLVYYPVYLYLNSDVVWNGSLLRLLWMEILEPLVNYLFFWGSFAFILYSAARYSLKGSAPILIYYAIGSVLRYLLQNVAFIVVMGLNAWESEFYVSDLLINIVMDLLIMGAATLLIVLWKRKKVPDSIFKSKNDFCIAEENFRFSRFFDFKNILLRTAFLMAIFPSAVRLLLRAWYDINLIVIRGIPVTDAGEVLLMITYYLTDCAGILVGYLIMFMILSALYLSDKKASLARGD